MMSDDLISRRTIKSLIETIRDCWAISPYVSANDMKLYSKVFNVVLNEISNCPTAFDKEKVIEELKDYLFDKYCIIEEDWRVAEIVEKGEIDYPENRWIPSDCPIKPKDKELCAIILKNNDDPVRIVQYRDGLFYHVHDILWHDCIFEYFETDEVSYWKPLDLPEDVNGSIQKEIDEVFEYET